MFNKNFYPTPSNLIERMVSKIGRPSKVTSILEPSAGKGDIINFLKGETFKYYRPKIRAIEKDETLYKSLMGQDITVIDRDFLEYNGGDIFDLIIMNPPFDRGDQHLLKAMDILYSGEIICLLNAETLKNPYSKTRQELQRRLKEDSAEVEYISDAFMDAERKTSVEVALVYIKRERSIERDFLKLCEDKQEDLPEIEEGFTQEVTTNNKIENLELRYNLDKQNGLHMITEFHRNSNATKFLSLKVTGVENADTLGETFQRQVNGLYENLREYYWNEALELKEVQERMTIKSRQDFRKALSKRNNLEFTAKNVHDFILSLIGGYEEVLTEGLMKLFDDLTRKHSYYREANRNSYLFHSFKTNEAYKVGEKIIIPFYGEGSFYNEYSGKMELSYRVKDELNDIDRVMNYIAGKKSYKSIVQAITEHMRGVQDGERTPKQPIESEFFKGIKFYKKGTLHLTFKDKDILRRFNLIACKDKGWIGRDYGTKAYHDCEEEEQEEIDNFEGKTDYVETYGGSLGFSKPRDLKALTKE